MNESDLKDRQAVGDVVTHLAFGAPIERADSLVALVAARCRLVHGEAMSASDEVLAAMLPEVLSAVFDACESAPTRSSAIARRVLEAMRLKPSLDFLGVEQLRADPSLRKVMSRTLEIIALNDSEPARRRSAEWGRSRVDELLRSPGRSRYHEEDPSARMRSRWCEATGDGGSTMRLLRWGSLPVVANGTEQEVTP